MNRVKTHDERCIDQERLNRKKTIIKFGTEISFSRRFQCSLWKGESSESCSAGKRPENGDLRITLTEHHANRLLTLLLSVINCIHTLHSSDQNVTGHIQQSTEGWSA